MPCWTFVCVAGGFVYGKKAPANLDRRSPPLYPLSGAICGSRSSPDRPAGHIKTLSGARQGEVRSVDDTRVALVAASASDEMATAAATAPTAA